MITTHTHTTITVTTTLVTISCTLKLVHNTNFTIISTKTIYSAANVLILCYNVQNNAQVTLLVLLYLQATQHAVTADSAPDYISSCTLIDQK